MKLAHTYIVSGITGLLYYAFYSFVPVSSLTLVLDGILPFAFTALTFLGVGAIAVNRK